MDYLETLVTYLMSSAGNLEKKEIEVPVSEIFNQGGEMTPRTQLANLNLKYA